MMTFDEILNKRRSVRAYDSRPVRNEDVLAMCEAARLAPSACNSQTWRFVAVTDRDTIDRLCSEALRPVIRNKWLREAPLIIVGCSQLDIVANRIGSAVTGIEYYRIDLGIAMEHMVLKAAELGLGTCWIGWFKEEKVREILGIPERVRVSALLAVGYPKDEPPRKRSRKPLQKVLFLERWGKSFQSEDRGNADSGE
jgi:nitroreductase